MAYCHSGTAVGTRILKEFPDKTLYERFTMPDSSWEGNDENVGLYFIKLVGTDGYIYYNLYAFPINTIPQYKYESTIDSINYAGVITTKTEINILNNYPSGYSIFTMYSSDSYISQTFKSNIPIFNSEDEVSINNYVNNGDDSGRTNVDLPEMPTNWKFYIDGLTNPTYYISWNCPGAADYEKSNFLVDIMYANYSDVNNRAIYNILQHNFTSYNSGYNVSFSQLNAIENDTFMPDFIENVLPKGDVAVILRLKYVTEKAVVYSNPVYVVLKYKGSNLDDMVRDYGNAIPSSTKVFYEDGEAVFSDVEVDGSTITFYSGVPSTNPDDPNYDPDYDKTDDDYSDDKDNIEADNDDNPINIGVSALTSTYKMTEARVKQIGSFLWNSNIFDDFSLINSNPIENIISLKAIPFEINGTDSIINLGNVNTGVYGEKISENFSKINVGSISIPKKYDSFLDYSPYTTVNIYLPYIGFKELNCSDVMGKTINVTYLIDVVTGGCLAQISVGSMRIYEFEGIIGIDIPITASNRAQIEASYIQSAATTIASAASGLGIAQLASGASKIAKAEKMTWYSTGAKAFSNILDSASAKYHFSTQGTPNPSCVSAANRTCFIIIDRPTADNISGYGHSIGYKCNLTKTLKNLSGLTVTTDNVDLSGITCTQTEKEELRQLLSSGVFL